MSEERPQHTQEPAEGDEEDVGAAGAERAGSSEGTGENAGDYEGQTSVRPQEPAEGGEEDVEAPGAERAGDGG
jgi:hypothetical protein